MQGDGQFNFKLVQTGQAAVLLALLWFLSEPLMLSLSLLCVSFIALRMTVVWRFPDLTEQLHQNWIKNVSALFVAGFIMSQSVSIGLLNAMVNLLYSGSCLWLLTLPQAVFMQASSRFEKDNEKLGLLLFFLLAVAFIYDQSLAMALIYFVTLLLALFVQLLLHNPYFKIDPLLALFSRKLLWSLPLAALMFIVLPNLPPFWKLPEQQTAATGLDDEMTPGDIADLAQSNRLAFRAQFDSENVPNKPSLYWRVMTMENFDGKTWQVANRRKQQNNFYQARNNSTDINELSYSIIAEATQQPWLYGLSGATSPSPKVYEAKDNRLSYPTKVTQRFKYDVRHSTTPPPRLSAIERRANLALPAGLHPETRQLAERLWQAQSQQSNTASYVSNILRFFSSGGFRYSLQPERLSGDHIDDFLFAKKVGFCAHFASATTVMLRMKGIPSRVVTGYQGGEFNPKGNYFNIYDNAAHAWVEYWQPTSQTQGRWVRVDPTAAVAPDRINFDLSSVLSDELSAAQAPIEIVKNIAWLNALRQQLQSLDYYWTVWVLDFDQQDQKQLWHQIRDIDLTKLLWLIGAIALFVALIVTHKLVKAKRHLPWHLTALHKLQRKLQKHHPELDLARPPHMTLQSYGVYLSEKCPQQAQEISTIIKHLNFALYNHSSPAQKKQVFQAINELLDS